MEKTERGESQTKEKKRDNGECHRREKKRWKETKGSVRGESRREEKTQRGESDITGLHCDETDTIITLLDGKKITRGNEE